jgi:hypothetical protein
LARETLSAARMDTNKDNAGKGSDPSDLAATPLVKAGYRSNSLHVLGVPHTIPHEDYLVCAFTAKVLLFPEVIQPFGWM